MTAAVLVVGGITRLTQSGLSIVDWDPLMGAVPPIGETQWAERFAQYRLFPEYRQLRSGMTLDAFKVIYFWEYLHRLIARALGLVFLMPWMVFWWSGRLSRPLAIRTLLLFALGAAQGLMGWLMVSSGLVDRPSVSHYRLAAHLTLAVVIFGFCVWLACDLGLAWTRAAAPRQGRRTMGIALLSVAALLAPQIVWGALGAGLKAGLSFNTFPLMAGRLVPSHLFTADPILVTVVAYPPAVQWVHRLLGTMLLVVTAIGWVRVRQAESDRASRRLSAILFAAVSVQYLLGVLTLLHAVPLGLALAHQVLALGIVGVWVMWAHHVRHLEVMVPATDRSLQSCADRDTPACVATGRKATE